MPKQDEMKYTKTHEWIFVEGENATIGISEHAQGEMGDVVFVELPNACSTFRIACLSPAGLIRTGGSACWWSQTIAVWFRTIRNLTG